MFNDPGKYQLTIQKIVCEDTSESHHDEVFLKIQRDGHFSARRPTIGNSPINMNDGDENTWIINETFDFDYDLLVTLWDQDTPRLPSFGTYLQSHDFVFGDGQQSPVELKNPNDAHYKIYFSLSQA